MLIEGRAGLTSTEDPFPTAVVGVQIGLCSMAPCGLGNSRGWRGLPRMPLLKSREIGECREGSTADRGSEQWIVGLVPCPDADDLVSRVEHGRSAVAGHGLPREGRLKSRRSVRGRCQLGNRPFRRPLIRNRSIGTPKPEDGDVVAHTGSGPKPKRRKRGKRALCAFTEAPFWNVSRSKAVCARVSWISATSRHFETPSAPMRVGS